MSGIAPTQVQHLAFGLVELGGSHGSASEVCMIPSVWQRRYLVEAFLVALDAPGEI